MPELTAHLDLPAILEALIVAAERPLSEAELVNVIADELREQGLLAPLPAAPAAAADPIDQPDAAASAEAPAAASEAGTAGSAAADGTAGEAAAPSASAAPRHAPALAHDAGAPLADASGMGQQALAPAPLVASGEASPAEQDGTAAAPAADPIMQLAALRQEVLAALDRLRASYQEPGRGTGRGLVLMEVAGGYTFRTAPLAASFIWRLLQAKPQRLSRAALECLAIIAYQQPVTKPQVDAVRGVDSSGVLKLLLERGLVRVLGRKDEPGRPLLYGTSQQFLALFNLKGLSDLPTLRDLEELGSDDELLEEPAEQSLREAVAPLPLDDEQSGDLVGSVDDAIRALNRSRRVIERSLGGPAAAAEDEEGAVEEAPGLVDAAAPAGESDGDASAAGVTGPSAAPPK